MAREITHKSLLIQKNSHFFMMRAEARRRLKNNNHFSQMTNILYSAPFVRTAVIGHAARHLRP
ncbi:MAG: hypothetical protein P8Z31_04120 [Gammaproteobacteria bacterium]